MVNLAVIELKGITKRFPGVVALKNVSFDLRRGEIHALVGENGAGKSTLIKLIAGVYHPDEGEINVFGKKMIIKDPLHSRDLGIAVIHQERNIIPEMTVSEMVFLDRYPKSRFGFIDKRRLNEDAQSLLKTKLGVSISPREQMKNLSVANQQLVEIAKALSLNPHIIVLDEPTSSLSQPESQSLFSILLSLKTQGVAMIYISHKLDELSPIADRITVLRDGEVTGHHETAKVERDVVIAEMVGRKIESKRSRSSGGAVKPYLQIVNLSKPNLLFNISMQFGKGEIVGIAGMVGARRTELAQCVFGADRDYTGEIRIDGKVVSIRSIEDALRIGIALVTEDRKRLGLVLQMPLMQNITLASLPSVSKFGWIFSKKETDIGNKYAEDLRIRARSLKTPVFNLSGGNQQKVIIAKWLASKFRVLILDEPTVGVDVLARNEIYDIIERLADEGICVAIISSDLEEIVTVCDRTYVMKEGRVTGELTGRRKTLEEIARLAT